MSLARLLLGAWLLLLALPLVAHAQPAQPTAASAQPSAEERARIEGLIGRLENEQQRSQLIEQLRLLLRAGAEQPKAPDVDGEGLGELGRHVFGSMAGDLSLRIETMLASMRPIAVMERFADWVARLFTDPAERDRFFEFAWKLGAILGAGIAAELLVRLALRRATQRLAAREATGIAARATQALLGILMVAIPLAAFAIAASATVPLVAPRPLTAVAVSQVVGAYVIARFINGLAALVLAPDGELPRLLRIGQETAAYLNVWIVRFTVIGVYGVFALEAARALGMPFMVHDSLLRLLGLALVALAAIVILQNREAVARWIDPPRSRGEDDPDAATPSAAREGLGRALGLARGYLAAIWHVLAIAYLALGYLVWAFAIAGGGAFLLRATLITLLTLAVAKGASSLQRRGVARLFSVSQDLATRHPLLEARANRYLSVLRGLVDLAILVLALSAILEAWGLRGFSWITTDVGRAATTRLLALAFFIGAAILAWEVASAVIESRLRALAGPSGQGPRSQRLRTFLPLLRNVIFIFIVTIAALLILSELGVNIAPLLAGAGVVGIAIGFGSQTLVKDVISGMFILFEDTVNVGDVVEVDGRTGVVEAVSIRSMRLRDGTGALHTIPFSNVSTVKNMTKDFAWYVFDLGVGYDSDLKQVVEVLRRVDAEARSDPELGRDIIEPMAIDGLDRFADSALIVRARVKTWPGRQWGVGRALNARIKAAFDAAGIDIPYPHQVAIQKRADPEPA